MHVIEWDNESDDEAGAEDEERDDAAAEDVRAPPARENIAGSVDSKKSFSREKKLSVLTWMRNKKASKGEIARHFGLPHHNYISRCLVQEQKLLQESRGARSIGSGRKAQWPQLEERLHAEFRTKPDAGIKVQGWWFVTRAKQLVRELYSEKVGDDDTIPFKVSMHWFRRFQSRWNVSLWAMTNRGQEEPERKLALVRKFHTDIRSAGEFEKKNIANMDQTPLPFDLNVGKTYAEKGSKTVWCRSVGGSGMNKRQATVQLTIYADGEPRVKPLIIFRATGQRITQQEKQQYDHHVTVHVQENAWCDESIFLFWARHMWRRDVATEKLLVIDSHWAQMTAWARTALKEECNTAVVTLHDT